MTNEEKEFYVTFRIDGRFVASVKAKTEKEARDKAEEVYYSSDFGVLHDIEGEPIIIEDENGNFVWEK